jgi:hypothetical protein
LSGSQLRALERAELARLGETGLREHLVDTGIRAHAVYAPITGANLDRLLEDRDLVRYPVRLAFEMGTLAGHQFAQPEPEAGGVVLYLHPSLKGRDHDVALAVAYFLPLINYGELINDDHCLIYGATLHGLTVDQYFSRLCGIADSLNIAQLERHNQVFST